MRVSQAVTNVFSRVVGMPSSGLAILRQLAIDHPRTPGVLEIARSLSIDAPAVTRLLIALERQDLIQREDDPRDARRRHVSLTVEGRSVFETVNARAHELERSLRAGVPDEEIATATRVLGRLRTAIEVHR